ncbi:hypothetical protein ACOSQ3_018524 [Xanthoceras sorbifolium]
MVEIRKQTTTTTTTTRHAKSRQGVAEKVEVIEAVIKTPETVIKTPNAVIKIYAEEQASNKGDIPKDSVVSGQDKAVSVPINGGVEIDGSTSKDLVVSGQDEAVSVGVNAAELLGSDYTNSSYLVGPQSTEGGSVDTGYFVVIDQRLVKLNSEEISSPKQRKWKRMTRARDALS